MTEPLWQAQDIAAATDGVAQGAWAATGVEIDSRRVRPGDLFIALEGERVDGHDFAAAALKAGAAGCLLDRPVSGLDPSAPVVVVEDTFAALWDLAAYARLRARAQVVGITGSVGKTGTKEALGLALGAQGKTHVTAGNYNNHIGLPLTLARMPKQTEFAVLEMGMNHAGEIAPLSQLGKPDVAVITTVEPVHLENFANVEGIADAKAEIFAGVPPTGAAILNRDNPHYARLVAHARTQGIGRIWSFGDHDGADCRLLECSLHQTASAVTAQVRDLTLQYSLAAPGRHWVQNSLAVLLAVKALGADVSVAARAMARIQPMKGRGRRGLIHLASGGAVTLIDESYNASPVSVAAALGVLRGTDVGDAGRRIAVLGDMLELGPEAPSLHAGLADAILANDIDRVHCCGPLMKALYDALPPARKGLYAPTAAALAPGVAQDVRAGDAVTVKGSLGSRMAAVVEVLEALDAGAPEAGGPMPVPFEHRAAGWTHPAALTPPFGKGGRHA